MAGLLCVLSPIAGKSLQTQRAWQVLTDAAPQPELLQTQTARQLPSDAVPTTGCALPPQRWPSDQMGPSGPIRISPYLMGAELPAHPLHFGHAFTHLDECPPWAPPVVSHATVVFNPPTRTLPFRLRFLLRVISRALALLAQHTAAMGFLL